MKALNILKINSSDVQCRCKSYKSYKKRCKMELTREEAYIWNENSHDEKYSTVQEMEESIHYLLKRIYDSFEEREMLLATKDLCSDSCKHYLSNNGNYPLYPCSECSRFYADMWESK